ncbi:MAG TPA: hypothetical protein VIL88_02485 [Devosia sp.]|jgi:hypothetical protein|uniref:hypothetical protein n=1 Tax=Devosia sp. TaxID=1871048 RepID=UPI002F9404A4
MSQSSFDFRPPVTPEERRALAALETCYGLVHSLIVEFGVDEATLVRFGKHAFNLPGSSTSICGILDEADAVLGAAKARVK